MHSNSRDPNAQLPSGVHRVHHADKNRDVSRSVWEFVFRILDDYFGRVRKVGHKPDQRAQSSQPDQPTERHVCRLSPGYTCTCPSGVCAADDATYRYARGPYLPVEHRVSAPEPNHLGNFRCPISGQLCSSSVCREWCEGSGSSPEVGHDRRSTKAANYYRNIDHETGDA